MTPSQILSIPTNQPWKLFKNPSNFVEDCRALRSKWFPDTNKDPLASQVMAHINVLIDAWRSNPTLQVPFLSEHDIPGVGQCIVSSDRIVYKFRSDADDFRQNMLHQKFPFPDENMRKNFENLFPKFDMIDVNDVAIKKPTSQLNLEDVLQSQGGQLPPVHVAWILSRLYNLACYLSYSKIAHVDLSPKNLYVDPKMHSIHLYGGWWYAKNFSLKALGAPKWVVDLSSDFATTGIPTRKLMSEQIRQTGRTLLGYPSIGAMKRAVLLPPPLVKWLSSPGSKEPLPEYADWGKCLEQSFGPRKFVEFKVTESDVYK